MSDDTPVYRLFYVPVNSTLKGVGGKLRTSMVNIAAVCIIREEQVTIHTANKRIESEPVLVVSDIIKQQPGETQQPATCDGEWFRAQRLVKISLDLCRINTTVNYQRAMLCPYNEDVGMRKDIAMAANTNYLKLVERYKQWGFYMVDTHWSNSILPRELFERIDISMNKQIDAAEADKLWRREMFYDAGLTEQGITYLRKQISKAVKNGKEMSYEEFLEALRDASRKKTRASAGESKKGRPNPVMCDPDLHMIQMDLAYTSDKKIYTI